jgi:tetratricopeptide (TPR) repeat protein
MRSSHPRIPERALAAMRRVLVAGVCTAACVGAPLAPRALPAQVEDTSALVRGQSLEDDNQLEAAAQAYREALARSPASVPAMLGLERVYAGLGRSAQILPLLDSAIAVAPRESAFRTAQLRTYRSLAQPDSARAAFERWTRDAPHDPAPYRTYSRMLIADGQTAAADTILRAAQADLGSARGCAYELAQLRAADGQWEASARAWRAALTDNSFLGQAALFSLAPTPLASRAAVRNALRAPPLSLGPVKALAQLELLWGSPRDGWEALRMLRPDSAVVDAWTDFAQRASDARAYLVARDALVAANEASPRPELVARAASAALDAGDAAGAVSLAESAEAKLDSATAARTVLEVHLRALAALGQPNEGERFLSLYSQYMAPSARDRYARLVAWGWVRNGRVDRARRLLTDAGGDDDQIEGWLALYQGDLARARELLAPSTDAQPELLTVLSLLERTKEERSPKAGSAFLTLARGDTLAAAAEFRAAAGTLPEAGSLLLATSARLYAARDSLASAVSVWKSIVDSLPHAPEAPEAELELARALRQTGDTQASVKHLEHLILTYPESAMVPQARREMELARRTVPSRADSSSQHRR